MAQAIAPSPAKSGSKLAPLAFLLGGVALATAMAKLLGFEFKGILIISGLCAFLGLMLGFAARRSASSGGRILALSGLLGSFVGIVLIGVSVAAIYNKHEDPKVTVEQDSMLKDAEAFKIDLGDNPDLKMK